MNKQNHHAAIFDLDGTLLDTLDDLANAANAALHSAGYPQHPSPPTVSSSATACVCSSAGPARKGSGSHRAYGFRSTLEHTGANYARDWAVRRGPYPHIPELLQELQRRGILGRRDEQAARMDAPHAQALLLPRVLSCSFRGLCRTCPINPDPTGALNAARHLDNIPNETVFVGDGNVTCCSPQCRNDCGRRGLGISGEPRTEKRRGQNPYDPLELLPFFEVRILACQG